VREGEGREAAYSEGYALWQAVARGNREMVEMLLERGANPNTGPDSSGSAVYSAFSHRQWEMVEVLRRHGGVVSADITALYRRTELAGELLEQEARGKLPAGAVSPDRTLAEDLLHYGATGGADDIVGMALERIEWGRADRRWFKVLTEPMSFWNHIPWLYAGMKELDRGTYIRCFRMILGRCDANVAGGFGRTALHEAAAMGDHVTAEECREFVEALLDAGARTDARDEILRSTPLGWACRWGRTETVRVLLERGADAAEREAEEWARPAAWARRKGNQEALGLVRAHGG
jgi:hypothetical protein